MTHETIEQRIKILKAETTSFNLETFKERLYCAYRKKLLGDLQACKSAEDFKGVLANNWSLVKGNALCYTARLDDPLTELLCDIAEDISKELQIKELTKVEKLKVAPICLLMPGVATESMYSKKDNAYQNYPKLTKVPLKMVLKSHILSDSGSYLIPVRVLLELPDPLDGHPHQLGNHYYNLDDATAKGHVTENEFHRLRQHSTHSQALIKAQEDHKALAKDAGLLSQLRDLIGGLRFNSTAGIGSEEAAGQGAYWALAQFNEYYQQLGEAVKDIPEDVKTALERLISISSDAAENLTATANIETCANTRQQELSQLLNKHEEALANIGLDSNHQARLLSAARTRIEENQETLKMLLTHNEPGYAGQDTLGLTLELLNTFSITPKITSIKTFQDFLTLSPDEIKLIVENKPSVRAGILQQFPDLEALVDFCLTTPLEPLEAILSAIRKQLSDKLILRSEDISACLMLMDGPRLPLMMQFLSERLPTIIFNGYVFSQVLKDLSPNQRTTIYKAFRGHLPAIINSGIDFGQVLLYLSIEQCNTVCETLKAKLPTIIKNGAGFQWAVLFLSIEQRTAVYEALKEELPAIINNGLDFKLVIQYLSSEQRTAVYEALKSQLPTLIKNDEDFGNALQFLSAEQRTAIFEALKVQLPTLIKSSFGLGLVLEYLSPEQCSVVCEALKVQLPSIIKDVNDFKQVLKNLTPKQCRVVCEANKNQLFKVIKTASDFMGIFHDLHERKCAVIYDVLKSHLGILIKNECDYDHVIERLNPERRIEVFKLLKAQLRAKIEQGVDLNNLPYWLASEQSLNALDCSANQKRVLQTEVCDLLANAEQKRNKAICHHFENQKRSISKIQEADKNEPRYNLRKRQKK